METINEPKNTLVGLFEAKNELEDFLFSENGELAPETALELERLEAALPAKIDGYYIVLKRLEAETELYSSIAKDFTEKAKTKENKHKQLKDHLKFCMGQQGLKELYGNQFEFKTSKPKNKVNILDESIVPHEYKTEKKELMIDKKRLLEDLELGIEVPGCVKELYTTLRSGVK